MNEEEKRAAMVEFERNRQLLSNISSQKQQLQMQVDVFKNSREELNKTNEKTVMKVVGNLIVNKDKEEMKKELDERVESLELKLKTMEKQEESTTKKLNSLKSQLEGAMQQGSGEESENKDTKKKTKKSN